MSEYVYRVIDPNGRPIGGGGYRGRQHVYVTEHTARGVATQKTNNLARREREGKYTVQRARVEWEDFE